MNAPRPSRALVSGTILLLAACASPNPVSSTDPTAPDGRAAAVDTTTATDLFPALPESGAIGRLRTRAAAQIGSTGAERTPPAWLPASEYISDDALEHAAAPLDAVLEGIRSQPRFAAASAAPVEASEADRDQAMRLYAKGRLARADENNSEALSALEAASKLDPGSFEIWRALGDAQMSAGLRSSGLRSFQNAAERGLDDVRAWALIGLEAVRRRDSANAVRWLLAARDGLMTGADPIAIAWIEVALGELLLEEHRVRAGAELVRSALSRPISDASRSTFQNEYATLVRRRPQLWLRVGDAEALLGDWAGAADAYDHAAGEASADLADDISLRRTAVFVADGRTAQAALSLLDRIRLSDGRVSGEDLRTLEQLGPKEPDLSMALAHVAASLAQDSGAVQSRLLLARFAASGSPVDVDTIDPEVTLRPAHVLELMRPIGNDAERWDFAQALTRHRPADAAAIADALFAGGLIQGPRLEVFSSGTDLLSLRVRLRMGLPERSGETPPAADSPEHIVAQIETATALGRWDEARRLLETVEATGGLTTVEALEAASHADLALRAWTELEDADDSIESTLLGARLALACDRKSEAARALLRAHEIDAADDRIYELMLRLLSDPGAFDERAKIEEAMRTMRANAPDAPTLEALEISQLVQRGFVADGHARAEALIDRLAAPTLADYGALMTIWNQAAERGDADLLESAELWLRRGLNADRPSEARAVALARLVALRSNASAALDALTTPPLAKTPALLNAEAALLKQADRKNEAFALLRPLYDHPTLSVGDTVQLAFVELDENGSLSESLVRLGSIPTDIRVRPEDLPSLVGLCNTLMSRMIERPTGTDESIEAGLAYATVAGFALDAGASLPEAYHRVRLRALAQAPGSTFEEIERATTQMHAALGSVSQAAFEDVYLMLLERSRTQDALLWASDTVMLGDELDADMWPVVAGQLAALGTAATVEAVMDRLDQHAMLSAAVAALSTQVDGEAQASVNLRAELAYSLAGIAAIRDRNLQAKELYLLTLRLEPEHPWACNDYGYMLVDRDEELDEAERLIEIAYKALPERTNVLDSIGWLRYRQGRFDGPDGALALLEQAAGAPDGATNATILDHLGDVRWMTGDVPGAADAWEKAEVVYFQQVRQLTTPEMQRQPVFARTQARLGLIRDKLRLLEIDGRDPPVARSNGTRRDPTE